METLERLLQQHPETPLQPTSSPSASALENKISPSILLIIVILAIIFFISGLLHLLVRFLLRPVNSRDPDEGDDVTALQGQLQQLFYLHDAGVDQSFIDALPLFHYSSIIGLKDPFDCAVCLCEFEPHDRLRLLPKCSHAFHTECIDTWLLSHSTCPLCRSNLLEGFSPRSGRLPVVCVLEAGSDGSREMDGDHDLEMGRVNSEFGSDRHLGSMREPELGSSRFELQGNSGEKIVTVKLGKFKNGESSNNNMNPSDSVVDSRRCFSMGSFEYVMDESSSLQVPIRTPAKKPSVTKTGYKPGGGGGGFRCAISEYGCDSRREFEVGHGNVNKCESFSVSKIWGRGRDPSKEKGGCSSFVGGRRTNSEIEINAEIGGDEDAQSCYSVESSASTTRRTLLWLMGRQQNKVVHSNLSLSSNNV